MLASNWHHRLLRYGFSPLINPRINIFVIISAVNKRHTETSQKSVKYFKGGYRSNVLGVFRHTERSDTRAHNRINLRTQS
jgi:hypothetical protein